MQTISKTINLNITHIIIASFVIHFIFLYMLKPRLVSSELKPEESKVFTVKLTPLIEQAIKKQIVDNERFNNKSADKAFLGKKNNKVERQTKSALNGSFKAAGKGDPNAQKQKRAKRSISDKSLRDAFRFPGTQAKKTKWPKKRAVKESLGRKGLRNGVMAERGLGQTNDFLEDIPLGDFTRLNTQEYRFYGFYHRIKLKLEQFWGVNLKEQAKKIFTQGRSIASGSKLVTSLQIVLNSKGEIVAVNINSTSGVKELDQASVKAFNQAGPFPNPPKDMIKNGQAKINWSFVVNT